MFLFSKKIPKLRATGSLVWWSRYEFAEKKFLLNFRISCFFGIHTSCDVKYFHANENFLGKITLKEMCRCRKSVYCDDCNFLKEILVQNLLFIILRHCKGLLMNFLFKNSTKSPAIKSSNTKDHEASLPSRFTLKFKGDSPLKWPHKESLLKTF